MTTLVSVIEYERDASHEAAWESLIDTDYYADCLVECALAAGKTLENVLNVLGDLVAQVEEYFRDCTEES